MSVVPRAALALLASLALADPAAAQNAAAPGPDQPRAIDLTYEFTVGGLRAFRAKGTIRLDGDAYAVESDFRKEGLVAAFSATFNGRNEVRGRTSGGALVPASGLSWIETRSVRTWLATYRGDGTFGERHDPVMQVRPERMVTPDQRRGALDPLNSAVAGYLAGASPCDRTYPVFDSRRRFDVTIQGAGSARLAPGEVPGAQGEALVCRGYIRKIAGYSRDSMSETEDNKNPPRLWFAKLDGSGRWLPVKMEMKTSFGDLLGKLTKIEVRALTDAERAAMRR